MILLTLILFAGCGADEIHAPISEEESSSSVDIMYVESEVSSSAEDAPAKDSESETALPTTSERFERITKRPLSEWTTEDFSELLSMSNHDLEVDLTKHMGGRNVIFGIIGSSVHFPNGSFDIIRSEHPRGYLKYAGNHSDYSKLIYPSIVTLGYSPHSKLLGAELGESLRDIIDVFGEAEIEYVVRVDGGAKAHIYFVRYTLDGLVFLFECDVTGELTELPPHPPLPTMDEILNSKVYNVHVLKEDCYLLERMDASILKE